MDTFDSTAFAVADHQVAHVYVQGIERRDVRRELEAIPGIEAVVEPGDLGLGHARSGEWIAMANDDSWSAYNDWLNERAAPDFAHSVDHPALRRPGSSVQLKRTFDSGETT